MSRTSGSNYSRPLALLTSLFFMWGFITVMNDVLINTFESIFDLSGFQSGLVQSAFFGAFFVISLIYFLVSSSTGKDPINRIGYKSGMAYSLVICGIGCMAFYPAAIFNSYSIFLLALFVLASGVTCLQICANPYAAILGSPETASSRLNFAQGLNSMGTTIGPLLGTVLIFRVFSETQGEATISSVSTTYLIYGAVFMLLAFGVALSKMPAFTNNERIEPGFGVLNFRHLAFGIIAIFFYVGGEVTIGSYLADLFMDDSVMGLGQEDANYFLAYYWGGAMIGRLMGSISLSGMPSRSRKLALMALVAIACFGFIYLAKSAASGSEISWESVSRLGLYVAFIGLNYLLFLLGQFKAARTLMVFSFAVSILLLVVSFGQGSLVFWSAISIGLFNSIMWSNIFTLAIRDLGKYTSQGSALLVMAIVGGAVFPPLHGALKDAVGIQLSFLLPVICFLYLAFYGWRGYAVKSSDA